MTSQKVSSHDNRINNSSPLETSYVFTKKVSCDGGRGAAGHPLVYLSITKNNSVTCPYCSKYFIFRTKSDADQVPANKKKPLVRV